MPSKNVVKNYVENSYYHIYNRGVEKRTIFVSETDCKVFLRYMKLYLSPKEDLLELNRLGQKTLRFLQHNLYEEVDLLAFALMPNHFHLLVKQNTADGIIKFMRRLATSYVMYFNNKNSRTGGLFQGTYKAVQILNDEYLLHLSRYIHLNPAHIKSDLNFSNFSSMSYYLGDKHATWVKPHEILNYFEGSDYSKFTYSNFVYDNLTDSRDILSNLTLEENF